MQIKELKVEPQDSGLRLDQYVYQHIGADVSRSRIQGLIKLGKVTVNSKSLKAHYKVRALDTVIVEIPGQDVSTIIAEDIPLDIVFEDEDILIVNKPVPMVTHPAAGNYARTLVNALLYHTKSLSSVNGPLRPGIVHRLDKDTSGLMVVAKSDFAHHNLSRQFREHTVNRVYIAAVFGNVEHDQGAIDLPIARHPMNRKQMTVSFVKSRDALTRYEVIKKYADATLLRLMPYTGRTHQLRVHLKFFGHPILGDARYSKAADFSRMALHAKILGFNHPRTGKFVQFESELPKEFKQILDNLEQKHA